MGSLGGDNDLTLAKALKDISKQSGRSLAIRLSQDSIPVALVNPLSDEDEDMYTTVVLALSRKKKYEQRLNIYKMEVSLSSPDLSPFTMDDVEWKTKLKKKPQQN